MEEVLCIQCGKQLKIGDWPFCPHAQGNHQVGIDGIPGGILIRHGLVNPDGSPMRFDSISDIKREANRRGLTLDGDTPKPYKVKWDGIRRKRSDEV